MSVATTTLPVDEMLATAARFHATDLLLLVPERMFAEDRGKIGISAEFDSRASAISLIRMEDELGIVLGKPVAVYDAAALREERLTFILEGAEHLG